LRQDEQKTFYSFLGLYLGSAFILMLIISILFYKIQYQSTYDLAVSKMQNQASLISAKIVHAHMQNHTLRRKDITPKEIYRFALYSKNKEKISGDINTKPNLKKLSYSDGKTLYVIDKSAFGHLDVYFVALSNQTFFKKIDELKKNIIVGFVLIYFVLCLIGYVLAKLFIRPIQSERMRLDKFIKNTTHELNTPVSALMMCTEQNSALNSEKNIQRIRLSAKRISEVYKDLTYLFLDEKKPKATTPISLGEIVNQQIQYLEPLASKKQIKITSDIIDKKFCIDEESFERLISNLISNAIKYNKRNGTIDIKLTNNQLIVKDTGIGIEESKLSDIFIRYNRVANIAGGFGIGLDIVFTICKEYDIDIDVKSELGKGSTFTLLF
jgi:two-component system OmpR family sensor kinase